MLQLFLQLFYRCSAISTIVFAIVLQFLQLFLQLFCNFYNCFAYLHDTKQSFCFVVLFVIFTQNNTPMIFDYYNDHKTELTGYSVMLVIFLLYYGWQLRKRPLPNVLFEASINLLLAVQTVKQIRKPDKCTQTTKTKKEA